MKSLNGILLTGGDADLWTRDEKEFTEFSKKTKFIIDNVINFNQNSFYPVYFQLIINLFIFFRLNLKFKIL